MQNINFTTGNLTSNQRTQFYKKIFFIFSKLFSERERERERELEIGSIINLKILSQIVTFLLILLNAQAIKQQ